MKWYGLRPFSPDRSLLPGLGQDSTIESSDIIIYLENSNEKMYCFTAVCLGEKRFYVVGPRRKHNALPEQVVPVVLCLVQGKLWYPADPVYLQVLSSAHSL